MQSFDFGISLKPTGIGNNRVPGFVFYFISLVLENLT